jgi:hypothetical protein
LIQVAYKGSGYDVDKDTANELESHIKRKTPISEDVLDKEVLANLNQELIYQKELNRFVCVT